MDTDTSPMPDAVLQNPAELALEIYKLLAPHASEVRLRAIQSAMASLGETALLPGHGAAKGTIGVEQTIGDYGELSFGPKASRWVQKYGITRAMLEEVLLLGDRIEISASSVPGVSKREMTVNCYLLVGLKNLLKTDVPSIDDSDAIAECKRMAAYDKNNHTTNRQSVGNKMSGTRPNFMLTGPGETAVAALVKQMTMS